MGSPPSPSPPTPPPPYEELRPQHITPGTAPGPVPASASGSAPSSLPPAPSQLPAPLQLSDPPPPTQYPAQYLSPGPNPALGASTAEIYNNWKLLPDPRSSSTQSLLSSDPYGYTPSPSLSASSAADSRGRRTLLLIYIHGFLGNDQSFRSFPAHVHALLTNLLVDSHVIHTKIYPRYKTYRTVDVARDNFSTWLTPHESPTTDVILLGHSMGGILAADIILMPNQSPYGQHPFKHRIIGHISLDCPFLGLHPGIIVSGISSLFKPAPQPQEPTTGSTTNAATDASSIYTLEPTSGLGASVTSPPPSSVNLVPPQAFSPGSTPSISSSSVSMSSSLAPSDPFFNPPFFNDTAFREQPFVRRVLHFASKYRDQNLISATAKHFISYLEFGGVMADLAGLESRYLHLRALEEVNDLQPPVLGRDPREPTTKVRFVNYYTICNGRPKLSKSEASKPEFNEEVGIQEPFVANETSDTETKHKDNPVKTEPPFLPIDSDVKSQLKTSIESSRPKALMDEHGETIQPLLSGSVSVATSTLDPRKLTSSDAESMSSDIDRLSLQSIEPTPIEEYVDLSNQDFELDLPPVPEELTPPNLPDLNLYTDKDARKQAEREVKRLQRAYDQAFKDRTKALHEREKIVEKRRKKALKEAERREKGARKEAERDEKETRREMEKGEKEARKEAERQEKEVQKQAGRQEKETRKETERRGKEAQKEQHRLEKETRRLEKERQQEFGIPSIPSYEPNPSMASSSSSLARSTIPNTRSSDPKPRKLRQFCNLPDPAPTAAGGYARDHTWVEVFMADVDEVGAHCGLFIPGLHYERLVGDVGSRIVGWVHEDMTRRAILDMGDEIK